MFILKPVRDAKLTNQLQEAFASLQMAMVGFCLRDRIYFPPRYVRLFCTSVPVEFKGLGHAILGNFSSDQMVIEFTKISK